MRINLKYFAGVIAAIVIGATSCTEENDLSTKNKGKDVPVVEVAKLSVKDSLVTVSLTALSDNAGQYAYAVVKGKDNPLPKSIDLILGNTIAGSIQSDIINVPESKKVSVTFPSVQATNYELFAVIITKEGLVGDVTRTPIYTPDNWGPRLNDFEAEAASSVTLVFNENIKLSDGAVKVTFIELYTGNESAPVTIGQDAISVEGTKATISFATQPAGGAIMVSIAEGAFIDDTGNLSVPFTSGYSEEEEDYLGVVWRVPSVDFVIENSYFAPKLLTNWETFTIDITFPFVVYPNSEVISVRDALTIFIRNAAGNNNLIVPLDKISLANGGKTLKISLPEQLRRESYFDVNIAQGYFYDALGNVNAEYIASKKTTKYTNGSELVLGSYTMEVTAEEPYLCEMMVEATSAPNDFVVSGLFDLSTQFLATHELVERKIYITGKSAADPTKNLFGTLLAYANEEKTLALGIFGGGNAGTDPIVLNVDGASKIVSVAAGGELALFQLQADKWAYLGAVELLEPGAKISYVTQAAANKTANKTFKYTPTTYKAKVNRVLKLN